ncbi:MAG TPA: DUF6178 family protein [Anaeromyxobacteraceae bacterium]|nr:DUF6178 family protein [Anaeromyxobacteraceae bacterium]
MEPTRDAGPLARARAELAAASGKRRLDVILSAPDPEGLLRALPAEEVYFLVRDLGLSDAAELVQLASPEQFRAFLDLDAWRGAAPDPDRVLPWLRAARAGALRSDAAAARFREQLGALDPELVSLVLLDALRVHDLQEDPDPELESDRFLRTPEGRYAVEFRVEGADYAAARALLDDLYARDPLEAARQLESVRWDLRSELEESALRWRSGRLADLGYPDLEEALSWYARPPAEPAAEAGLPDRPPGFLLAQFRRGSLLDRAAARLGPEAADRFEQQLLTAANAVLVADAVDPSDLEAVRRSVESARAMLELGLEAAAGSDEGRAAEALAATPLKRLFQQGFGRVLELRWRAERLLGSGGGTRQAPVLDPPLGEALSALARRRPLYFPGLEVAREEWGGPAAAAGAPRPFLASAELSRTAAALGEVEALLELGRRLGLLPPPPGAPAGSRLLALYLTALANERLGRAFSPEPLPPSELPAAARALAQLDDPRLGSAGEAGALLASMARRRAEELQLVRDGAAPGPGHLTALLLDIR